MEPFVPPPPSGNLLSIWFRVKKVNLTNQSRSPRPSRSTPSTSSSVRAGGTKGWSLTDPCRFCPWTTCWPVRSGLLTPSSTTGRNLWPTTWRHLTNYCVWWTTARSSTRWGKTCWGLDPVVVQFQLPCCRYGLNTIPAESSHRWCSVLYSTIIFSIINEFRKVSVTIINLKTDVSKHNMA